MAIKHTGTQTQLFACVDGKVGWRIDLTIIGSKETSPQASAEMLQALKQLGLVEQAPSVIQRCPRSSN